MPHGQHAETIALRGLTFLLSEPRQLERFLLETGLTPEELRANADSREVLEASLSVLVHDEALLLTFAANAGVRPEDVVAAHTELGHRRRSTATAGISMTRTPYRIGIDLGGTKIEGLALDKTNDIAAGPIRIETPRNDYRATLAAIAQLVGQLEAVLGPNSSPATVGIGIPGSITKTTKRVQNANSTWLNDQLLVHDLETVLARPVAPGQ